MPDEIEFGDNVRVLDNTKARELGLVGLVGQVYGITTPSVIEVEVIGELKEDKAINVSFKEKSATYWFSADLLEYVDHAPGTEVSIKGSKKKWVRTEDGQWKAHSERKPWWRVW